MWYYSCVQMYSNLYGDTDLVSRHAEVVMSLSFKEPHIYALEIINEVNENDVTIHHAWIVNVQVSPLG